MSEAAITRRMAGPVLPALIAAAGDRAVLRFLEYFTVNIRNKNTRAAYGRAAADFLHWCEEQGIDALGRVQPVHVAAYIELLQAERSAPTVKQHLACIRMLFDWLVIGQVMPTNPAHSVRGPRHSVAKGVTPVLSSEEATALLTGMNVSTVVGLRDRAIIAVMTYTFARVGAVVVLTVEDYFSQKKRWWLRSMRKTASSTKCLAITSSKNISMPTSRLRALKTTARGRCSAPRLARQRNSAESIRRGDVWSMVRRRAAGAGIATAIGCHTFRATGITDYLTNGGRIEVAQRMAGHSTAKTTGLYDRRNDDISVGEVERIGI
jgi:integrase/recombinase XerD